MDDAPADALPQRAPARPEQSPRRPPSLARPWWRAHHLDVPHMRPDGVRASNEHPLHGAGRACGGADLHQSCLTKRGERSAGSTHSEPECTVAVRCTCAARHPLPWWRAESASRLRPPRFEQPPPNWRPHGSPRRVELGSSTSAATARQHNRKAARSIPWMPRSLPSGVPPAFRTADQIGSDPERTRGIGREIRKIQARVS